MQDLNDIVLERMEIHLLAQREKSRAPGIGCAYRGEHGRTCAVGCLIDDEWYHEGLEGQSADEEEVLCAITASLGFTPDAQLLRAGQRIHDSYAPQKWEEQFAELRRLGPGAWLATQEDKNIDPT